MFINRIDRAKAFKIAQLSLESANWSACI